MKNEDLLRITVLFLVAIVASSANSEDIQNSVGDGGTDNDGDVSIVQILLNQIPSSEGGPQNLLVPDAVLAQRPSVVTLSDSHYAHRDGKCPSRRT